MTAKARTWRDDQPIYRQIADALIGRILDRVYEEGTLLPSVRQLAEEFDVSPLTAAAVMKDVEKRGVTLKRRGVGNEIRSGARAKLLKVERRIFFEDEWPHLRERLKRLEISLDDLK